MRCYSLQIDDDALFENIPKRTAFVIRPLNPMPNFEVNRLYFQQLEYKMDCTGYPVNYIYFEIGCCGNPNFPYENIQFKQSTNLILSHFQE